MCGVFGFVGDLPATEWRKAHRLLQALAAAHEDRGVDAAGYAALPTRGEMLWQRRPGPARELFEDVGFAALRRRRILLAIGHTRLATNGVPAVNGNNHPHLAGEWALVHNGFVPDHAGIAASLRLPLRSECDSEILVRALEAYGEQHGPGVCAAIGGSQSVLAINGHTRRLLAWTNGRMPLVAFRVKGWRAIWWASTQALAEDALAEGGFEATFAVATPGRLYQFEAQGGRVTQTPRPLAAPAGRASPATPGSAPR